METDIIQYDNQQQSTVEPLVSVHNLTKIYQLGQSEVRALQEITLQIHPGEFVAITGASGSGKTTFMNIIGCMDKPTSGTYWLKGLQVSHMQPDQLADIRNRYIGFIFQNFQLLARESALANVMLPLMYRGLPQQEQWQRARQALEFVGLGDRIHHHPTQLSGGQQQRVAIARALVSQPSLILADEPTGNLDTTTSREILELLQAFNRQGMTVIIITHDQEIASLAGRRIMFRDGHLVDGNTPSRPLLEQIKELSTDEQH